MKAALAAILALSVLAGCNREDVLPGPRQDLRPDQVAVAPVTPLALSAPVASADWTHKAGNPTHDPGNAALDLPLQRLWSVNIGQGAGRRHRIYADPVVSGGRVFAMDSRARVTAVSLAGATLWSRDLTPASDSSNDASGGGLAATGGRVYATTGFGELVVLDAGSGGVIWRQDLSAAALGAPTVVGATVYVVSRDSRGWAIDAGTGRVQWEVTGVPSPAGVDGGGAPAVGPELVYFPMNSGEVLATVRDSGTQAWSAPIVGDRPGRAYAAFDDVTGDPVITGNVLYAGNPTGQTMAIDASSGQRIWSAREGAMSPPVVAGGSVFVVSDANELLRLDAGSGARVWATELPRFTTQRLRRRKAVHAHYGPVLAGSRLIVASDDGLIRVFDPTTGGLVATTELRGGATSNPVVANRMLFVVDTDGRLNAYR